MRGTSAFHSTIRNPQSAIGVTVLSIAGSDPSGGAGIQADLKVFQALGAFGMAAPAALTIQNSKGVFGVEAVSSRILSKQLETLFSDIKPEAVKTGMLLTRRNVDVVASCVKKFRVKNLVVDPLLRSSSGKTLLEPGAVAGLKNKIFSSALIITPNIPEAEALTGHTIKSETDMDFAAGRLLDMGPSYVLIKGGHGTWSATDTLYGGTTVLSFSTTRRKGEFHGTGCLLSSAIAVFIARGYAVEKAVERAKQFVDSMLKTARAPGTLSRIRYFLF